MVDNGISNAQSAVNSAADIKKAARFRVQLFVFIWCGRWDLNPHGFTHTPLKRARLPISPLPHDR